MNVSCSTCKNWNPASSKCVSNGIVMLGTDRCSGYVPIASELTLMQRFFRSDVWVVVFAIWILFGLFLWIGPK